MEAIVIHPKSKEQLDAIKAFAKALKLDFETKKDENPYNPDFVKQIVEGQKSAKNGNVTRIKDTKNIWDDIL